jgi:membrane protein
MGQFRFFRFFYHLNLKNIKKTLSRAFERRLIGLSAEIAYNAMLALFPTILAILTAISLFEDSIQSLMRNFASQYQDVLPKIVWELLKDFVAEITQIKSKGLFSVSFIVTIWISSGALGATMNALDHIHNIPLNLRRPFWKAKLISLFITFGTIFLLVIASFLVFLGDLAVKVAVDLMIKFPVSTAGASLLVTIWKLLSWPIALGTVTLIFALIYKISKVPRDKRRPFLKITLVFLVLGIGSILLLIIAFLLGFVNNQIALIMDNTTDISLESNTELASVLVKIWQFLSWPVALAFVSLAFAFIYRIGPSVWLPGTPILPGAILAAISWAILSGLFRLYVSNFGQYNRVYGAVGAVIVLMLWLQMTSLVMLLGNQFNTTIGEILDQQEKQLLSDS